MDDRFAPAEAAFRKANSLSPDPVVLDLDLARIAARRGRAAEALAKLQPYLDRHMASEGEVPYQLLAEVLKKLGRESELLDRLGKLHAADKANVALGYFLAARVSQGRQVRFGRDDLYGACRPRTGPPDLSAPGGNLPQAAPARQAAGPAGQGNDHVRIARTAWPGSEAADHRRRSLRQPCRGRPQRRPTRGLEAADYAQFLSLGMLAQERKQYDVASEFFELALSADATKAGEVLLAWGIGSLIAERPAEAAKIFQRGIDAQVVPGGNPVFHFYLSSALAAAASPDAAHSRRGLVCCPHRGEA